MKIKSIFLLVILNLSSYSFSENFFYFSTYEWGLLIQQNIITVVQKKTYDFEAKFEKITTILEQKLHQENINQFHNEHSSISHEWPNPHWNSRAYLHRHLVLNNLLTSEELLGLLKQLSETNDTSETLQTNIDQYEKLLERWQDKAIITPTRTNKKFDLSKVKLVIKRI